MGHVLSAVPPKSTALKRQWRQGDGVPKGPTPFSGPLSDRVEGARDQQGTPASSVGVQEDPSTALGIRVSQGWGLAPAVETCGVKTPSVEREEDAAA